MSKGYTYHYIQPYEPEKPASVEPLLECPFCEKALTEEGGITLSLIVGGQDIEVSTCLDNNGQLIDTDDDAVAKGFHGETCCGHCGESLVHYEIQNLEEGFPCP